MVGGSTFGKMFGVERRPYVLNPSIFNLALNKEAKIANIWDRDRGVGC